MSDVCSLANHDGRSEVLSYSFVSTRPAADVSDTQYLTLKPGIPIEDMPQRAPGQDETSLALVDCVLAELMLYEVI